MSEQEKKQQRIYDLLDAETKPKFICLPYTKTKKKISLKKRFLRKWRWGGGLHEKRKEGFLTALSAAIKKVPTTLIRKHANELKDQEKTVRIEIK